MSSSSSSTLPGLKVSLFDSSCSPLSGDQSKFVENSLLVYHKKRFKKNKKKVIEFCASSILRFIQTFTDDHLVTLINAPRNLRLHTFEYDIIYVDEFPLFIYDRIYKRKWRVKKCSVFFEENSDETNRTRIISS